MTEHKNIYSALCAAQAEFGKVQKGSTNPAFKSRYADLADVAGVVIPTLSAHGVAVFHYIVNDSDVTAMRTEFVHAASESRIACDVPLIVNKNDMQGFKSATTYAKRIGLESLSGVAPEDDDGNAAAKAPPAPRQQAPAGPPKEAIEAATSSLFNAASLDALKAIFLGLPTSVRSVQTVIDAKDTRKAELETAPADNADLGGDGIPY
jgi:hypothetical protein